MLRLASAGAAGGLLIVAALPGCASPLDDVESAAAATWHVESDGRRPGADSAGISRPSRPDSAAISTAPEIDETSDLRASLIYAALHSAELEAAYHRWQAALERVPQVTALPDPMVSYGYFINEVETRVGPQQHRVAVAQTFPWFGTLKQRGDVASQAAMVAFERYEAARLQLFRRVKDAYDELFYLRGAIELTKENLGLLEQFERIVRARYRVAAASHPDLIRTQVALGKLEDRLRQLEEMRHPLAARFNGALNRAPDAPVPWPDSIPEPVLTLDDEAMRELLRRRNPELAAISREIDQYRAASRLARTEGMPDLTFSVDYIVVDEAANSSLSESGDDAVIAGIGVSVPLWRDKYEAGVREAVRRRLATAASRAAAENRLETALQTALFDYRDARRRIGLYRDDLVPKARESVEATLSAYEAATSSFLDLLDAERVLLELQLAERRARADAGNAMAQIEMLVGSDLTSASSSSSSSLPGEESVEDDSP
ncbi:MAG: TolC family protein [Planctomycetota bacterium]